MPTEKKAKTPPKYQKKVKPETAVTEEAPDVTEEAPAVTEEAPDVTEEAPLPADVLEGAEEDAPVELVAEPIISEEEAPLPADVEEAELLKERKPNGIRLGSLPLGVDFYFEGDCYRTKSVDETADRVRVAYLEWAPGGAGKIETQTMSMDAETLVST